MLPPPPENLAAWGTLITLGAAMIAAMRRWLINPILMAIDRHADQHEMMMRELTPQHDDGDPDYARGLPWEERRLPLRDLAILTRVGVLKIESQMHEHTHYSRQAIKVVNADRVARGLSPIDEEERPGA